MFSSLSPIIQLVLAGAVGLLIGLLISSLFSREPKSSGETPLPKEFIEQVEENFPDGFPPKTNIVKEIKDKTLKNKAVYGDKYMPGSRNYNQDNVTLVLQGPVKLVAQGSNYVLKANHVNSNGEEMKGDYDPTFTAQYRSDRGAPVKNTRASIWPKAVEKRKNTIKLGKK